MPTIEQLMLRSDSCDDNEARDLYALYEGNREFERRLTRFLLQRPREPGIQYDVRCKEYQYINYMGEILDHFSTMLFTSKPVAIAFDVDDKGIKGEQVLDLDSYYNRLREDVDLSGRDIDAFFLDRATEAMILGKSWIAIETPGNINDATNRHEFESQGLGDCWLRALCHNSVLDWETDGSGNLEWVLYHSSSSKRVSLSGGRDRVTETWTHYTTENVDTYQITYPRNERPAPKTEVPLIDSKPHNFGCCPVVCLELPVAQHIAARLKSPQLAHFRAINGNAWGLSQTCYATPIAKVADQESFSEMIMGAGHGIVIGVDEDYDWIAPPGAHFVALEKNISSLKDEIHRIAYQMHLGVENNAASVGRTAESKSVDAEATRVALTAYGRVVKACIERVYDMISSVRGDKMVWDIAGLDDFAGVDTGGLITLCTDLTAAGGVPSKTFNTRLKIKLAESILPDLDEETKADIRQEITDGIEAEPSQEEKELAQFEAMHQIVNENAPPTTAASGGKPKGSPKGGKFGAPAPSIKKKKGG